LKKITLKRKLLGVRRHFLVGNDRLLVGPEEVKTTLFTAHSKYFKSSFISLGINHATIVQKIKLRNISDKS
jgi:hypothetical protein